MCFVCGDGGIKMYPKHPKQKTPLFREHVNCIIVVLYNNVRELTVEVLVLLQYIVRNNFYASF